MAIAQTGYRNVAAAIGLIVCSLLFTPWWCLTHVRQPAPPIFDIRDLAAYGSNITTRANNNNNAIPGWSSPLSTYLDTFLASSTPKAKRLSLASKWPQSLLTSDEDLAKTRYGWTYSRAPIADHGDDFMPEHGLEAGFDDLGISSCKEDWYQVSTVHSSKSKSNGVTYPVSWGTYQSLFNLRDGVIVANTNYGPLWQYDNLQLGIPDDEIVPLRQWSDLLFLALQKTIADASTGSVMSINHVFRHLINDEIKEKLDTITGGNDIYDYPGKWPSLSYSISETQALVTLSTTNGNGVAYLLGTHKSQMGIRTIDRVNIFNCPTRIGFDPSKGQLRQEYSSDSETEADMIPTWCIYLHAVNGPLPNF